MKNNYVHELQNKEDELLLKNQEIQELTCSVYNYAQCTHV